MIIELDKITSGGLDFQEIPRLGDLADETGNSFEAREPSLRGRVVRARQGAELEARLEASLRLCCSRCLERFDLPLGVDFFLVLHPDPAEQGPGELKVTRDNAALFHAEGRRADLDQIAREQIYLHLPMKLLCSPSCQGLCPTCGANRNRITCGCGGESVDPRLAPLAELKRRMGES